MPGNEKQADRQGNGDRQAQLHKEGILARPVRVDITDIPQINTP